jgi:hypothetical protein
MKADALMSRPEDHREGGDERFTNMEWVVLKPQNLPRELLLLTDSPPVTSCSSISDLITAAYKNNPLPCEIFESIQANCSAEDITIAEYVEQD